MFAASVGLLRAIRIGDVDGGAITEVHQTTDNVSIACFQAAQEDLPAITHRPKVHLPDPGFAFFINHIDHDAILPLSYRLLVHGNHIVTTLQLLPYPDILP